MSDQRKDGWEKASIILQPVGGLVTGLALAIVGIYASHSLDRKQAMDSNYRLYADLMSKREESDSNLRKDMFNSMISSFLNPKKTGLEERVLNLELLAYNFHEALNLGPLFKHVYKEINRSQVPEADKYKRRLEGAATALSAQQIAAVQDSGLIKRGRPLDFQDLKDHPEGVQVIDETLRLRSSGIDARDAGAHERHFTVWAFDFNSDKKDVQIHLRVSPSEKESSPVQRAPDDDMDPDYIDTTFWAGLFDFPMIANIRLSHGWRCAIVITQFQEGVGANIALAYFPGSRASLKEKPYYDEVIHELVNTRGLLE